MFKKIRIAALSALLLLMGTISMANAWPDLPPTKAFVSGPGIQGELQITDENILRALKLGGLENFDRGAIPAPQVMGDAFRIIRYFEDGTFRMGDLNYYPGTNGGPGAVYFQDGPMKNGDRSPYNNQWFSTIASSDQLLQNYIRNETSASALQAAWLVRNVGSEQQTLAFDAASKTASFILPKGLRSADGTAYWGTSFAGGMTALHSFDVTNGSIRASLGYEGNWTLGAVSATGKWLALKRIPTAQEQEAYTAANAWKTNIAVVDAETGKTTRTIALDGNFDVDALKKDGTWLYLIQHLPAIKPDHYQVRLYDLSIGQLTEGVIVDKRNIDEEMAGYPTEQVASADGQWLFTLYVGMQEEHAFIHALNVQEGYAWCIDLPSGEGDTATQERYSLALAPDGHTIYASNAVLGVLAISDMMNLGEPRIVQFVTPTKVNAGDLITRSSVVSRNGKYVYMSDAASLWQYDVGAGTARQARRETMPILGLGLSADNTELLIARADHSVSTIPVGAIAASVQTASMTSGQNQ